MAGKVKSAKSRTAFRVKLVIFTLVLIAYGVSAYFFRADIDRFLNLEKYNGTSDMSPAKNPDGGSAAEGSFESGRLKVHFVDVGQGDAAVIELPDDKTMIIDGGKAKEKDRFFTYMEKSLSEVTGFDYAVLTHSDEDHCGGLPDILGKYPMRENGVIYRPNQASTYKGFTDPGLSKTGEEGFWGNYTEYSAGKNTAAYKKFVSAAYSQTAANVKVLVTDARTETGAGTNKVPFQTAGGADVTKQDGSGKLLRNSKMDIFGDVENIGVYDAGSDYLITFYAPSRPAWKDVNDCSPVIALDYQGKRFIFTGDSEKSGEQNFTDDIKAGRISFDKKADVIKLGHHGSRTSSSEAYLDAVLQSKDNPSALAVISCGAGNSYGHPHKETLDRLTGKYGFKSENILRTDKEGTIVLSVVKVITGGVAEGRLLYGTVEIIQSDGFEPLSWITIGGGIVAASFVLLFCIRVSKKGKITVAVPAASAKTAYSSPKTSASKTSAPTNAAKTSVTKTSASKSSAAKKTGATPKSGASKTSSSKAKTASSGGSDIDKLVDEIKKKFKK